MLNEVSKPGTGDDSTMVLIIVRSQGDCQLGNDTGCWVDVIHLAGLVSFHSLDLQNLLGPRPEFSFLQKQDLKQITLECKNYTHYYLS